MRRPPRRQHRDRDEQPLSGSSLLELAVWNTALGAVVIGSSTSTTRYVNVYLLG
jgi:hypothetical protein